MSARGVPLRHMVCPFCGSESTHVIDSRPVEAGAAIRRRRVCDGCGLRFTTYERADVPLIVRKRDGSLQPFDLDKVKAGMRNALADRPVADKQLDRVLEQIGREARSFGRVVPSDEIGRMVLGHLAELDQVAYLRFASVYKEFEGTHDFQRELAALEELDGS